jgi:hypothetical protein
MADEPLETEVYGPHKPTDSNCPTYYDGCHCTVDALKHNIERAEKAERELKDLKDSNAHEDMIFEDLLPGKATLYDRIVALIASRDHWRDEAKKAGIVEDRLLKEAEPKPKE